MNGIDVESIVVFLPKYSMHGPPATPPKSALSGISEPIHMLCNINLKCDSFLDARKSDYSTFCKQYTMDLKLNDDIWYLHNIYL